MLRRAVASLIAASLAPLLFACAPDQDRAAFADDVGTDTGGGEDDAGAADPADGCGPLAPRNADEIALCTEQGEPILARLALPGGTAPPGGWPGIVLLHGSSGLFRPADDDSCSEELHGRFAQWAELLTERGYAVIMPSSFASRGYCDAYEASDDEDDVDRIVTRAYDAAAAASWLCRHPQIDCARLGVLGFSHGASVALLVMHEQLDDAEDPRLWDLTIPRLAAGVAYYPGCGLDGQLANRLDDELRDRYFFPTGPVFVPHAGKDHLAERCEELREPQVDEIAFERGIEIDLFQLEVYPGAKHGFDVYDDWDPKPNLHARDDAQARTLAKLEDWLSPGGGGGTGSGSGKKKKKQR